MRVFYQIFIDNEYYIEGHCLEHDSKRAHDMNFQTVLAMLLNQLVTRFYFKDLAVNEKQIRILLVPYNDEPYTTTVELKANTEFLQISVDYEPEFQRIRQILDAVLKAYIHRMKFLTDKAKLENHRIIERIIGGRHVESEQ